MGMGQRQTTWEKKNYYIVGESLTVLASQAQLTSLVFTYAMVYILREVPMSNSLANYSTLILCLLI